MFFFSNSYTKEDLQKGWSWVIAFELYWLFQKSHPWTPTTHGTIKVLIPRDMGEITPTHEGNMGSHGMASKLFSYPIWSSIKGAFEMGSLQVSCRDWKLSWLHGKKSYFTDITSASCNKHDVLGQQKNWKLHLFSVWISAYLTWTWTCLKCWNIFGRFSYSALTWATWGVGDVTMIHPEQHRFNNVG